MSKDLKERWYRFHPVEFDMRIKDGTLALGRVCCDFVIVEIDDANYRVRFAPKGEA
jgi:hypothetical protein